MDRLSPFLDRFSLSARIFFSGRLCGASSDHVTRTAGHLHVLRTGILHILQSAGPPTVITEPTILFYPRPTPHTFQSDGADILCAFIDFGAGLLNPLTAALPPLLAVPLASAPPLAPAAQLLFTEAFSAHEGRQAAVDRLAEYFLILLLRYAIDARLVRSGILLALADEHLARALHAIHQNPEQAWTLEDLARIAAMSRARFAAHFLAITGQTPFAYLALWRIGVAQALLKKGAPLKRIASSVGFTTPEALTRSFSHHTGLSPTAWLAAQQAP